MPPGFFTPNCTSRTAQIFEQNLKRNMDKKPKEPSPKFGMRSPLKIQQDKYQFSDHNDPSSVQYKVATYREREEDNIDMVRLIDDCINTWEEETEPDLDLNQVIDECFHDLNLNEEKDENNLQLVPFDYSDVNINKLKDFKRTDPTLKRLKLVRFIEAFDMQDLHIPSDVLGLLAKYTCYREAPYEFDYSDANVVKLIHFKLLDPNLRRLKLMKFTEAFNLQDLHIPADVFGLVAKYIPFECTTCRPVQALFGTRQQLIWHDQDEHQVYDFSTMNEIKSRCSVTTCDEIFLTDEARDAHIRRCHPGYQFINLHYAPLVVQATRSQEEFVNNMVDLIPNDQNGQNVGNGENNQDGEPSQHVDCLL